MEKNLGPLTRDVMLEKYQEIITMNWKNIANLNPVVMKWAGKTVNGVFDHITITPLDEEGNEVKLKGAVKGDEGAIKLDFGSAGRTAQVRFTLLTTKHPALKAPRGRVRRFQAALRTEGDETFIVLKLTDSTLEVAPKGKKRGGEGEEQAQETKKEAEKAPAPEAKAEQQETA